MTNKPPYDPRVDVLMGGCDPDIRDHDHTRSGGVSEKIKIERDEAKRYQQYHEWKNQQNMNQLHNHYSKYIDIGGADSRSMSDANIRNHLIAKTKAKVIKRGGKKTKKQKEGGAQTLNKEEMRHNALSRGLGLTLKPSRTLKKGDKKNGGKVTIPPVLSKKKKISVVKKNYRVKPQIGPK